MQIFEGSYTYSVIAEVKSIYSETSYNATSTEYSTCFLKLFSLHCIKISCLGININKKASIVQSLVIEQTKLNIQVEYP